MPSFKRNGFVQIQNCFFIFTLEGAILTDEMNHRFFDHEPPFFSRFFLYQGTVDPNHGGIIQQMSFTLIGPISMRDLPDVIGSENQRILWGEEEEVKNADTAMWQTEKIHHVYCSPVGVKATGA